MKHRVRFLILLAALSPLPVFGAGKELSGAYTPANSVCPTPEEAREKMSVPDGYEVRCFAHEPMVQNPVAMTWDERGRLWIVEAYEYPEGTKLAEDQRPFGGEAGDDHYRPVPGFCKGMGERGNGAPEIPRDRVIVLEDADNDGAADKRTVFLQGLNLASAILCGDGGIYIGQQPHLLHFRDTDGDGHADEWKVLLTGFGREDTHELLNSFCWGPDGWLYMTHGVFTNSKVRKPGVPEDKGFKFDAGIGRMKVSHNGGKDGPVALDFEVFADGTSNPWGCDYDAAGNFFVSACVIDHLFHMAPGGLYQRQGGAPENPYAYELLPSIVTHKHFRAAYAGVQVYQGGAYPKDTWGHLFIGNIHDNAIHEEVVTPLGATFKAETRRDFLRANDGWFRPVSTQTGPDGFLWIMDWCDKYPCYQNAKANPDGVDRDKGRIWRVVATGAKNEISRESQDLNLRELSPAALVKILEHPNSWMRRTARRMLVELPEVPVPDKEAMAKKWQESSSSISRIEAFWALWNIGAQPEPALAVKSGDPSIRTWLARFSGEAAGSVAADELPTLARDSVPGVRLAAATAMRQTTAGGLTVNRGKGATPADKSFQSLLTGLMTANAQSPDATMPFAIWMGLEPALAANPAATLEELARLAPACQPLSRTLSHKSMRRLCDTREVKNMDLAVQFCEKIADQKVLLAHALDGLVKGQESGVLRPTMDVSAQLAAWRGSDNADVRKQAQQLAVLWGDPTATQALLASLADDKAKIGDRLAALQIMRKVNNDTVRAGLVKLLDSQPPQALALEAIRAAADLGGDSFMPALARLAGSKDHALRLAALSATAGRTDWAHAMLDAIANGRVSAAEFPATVRRQLATHSDKKIRDHAFRVLGAWQESSEDTKALIAAKRKACLEGTPDLENGKLIFQTTCAVCHAFHGGGQKVGPDLIGSGRSNLDALLTNVIDPNQIIGNGYENFLVTTRDNRVISGRVIEDTPSHVKLLMIGGQEQIVPRDQVASVENTKVSLMPQGFGALPDDTFRNLVWYILAPPEEGPLTKEKKQMLSTSIDAPAAKPKSQWHRADWEAVSLWNPAWKINAPEFERTPVKLADYYGKSNVLLVHPESESKPASFTAKMKVPAANPTLQFSVAADDRGDWEMRAKVNGQEIKRMAVNHDKPRWKDAQIDLSQYAGQEVEISLETWASGWAWEFAYWHGIEFKK